MNGEIPPITPSPALAALIHEEWPDPARRVCATIAERMVAAMSDTMNSVIDQEGADVAPDK